MEAKYWSALTAATKASARPPSDLSASTPSTQVHIDIFEMLCDETVRKYAGVHRYGDY